MVPAVPVAGGVVIIGLAGGAMLPAVVLGGAMLPALPDELGGVIEPGVAELPLVAPVIGAVTGPFTLGEQLAPMHAASPCLPSPLLLLLSSPPQPVTTRKTVVPTNHNLHPVPIIHHPVSSVSLACYAFSSPEGSGSTMGTVGSEQSQNGVTRAVSVFAGDG
jgi:hypothetical protein